MAKWGGHPPNSCPLAVLLNQPEKGTLKTLRGWIPNYLDPAFSLETSHFPGSLGSPYKNKQAKSKQRGGATERQAPEIAELATIMTDSMTMIGIISLALGTRSSLGITGQSWGWSQTTSV